MNAVARWGWRTVIVACAVGISTLYAPLQAAERTYRDFVFAEPPKLLPHLSMETGSGDKFTYEAFRGKVTLLNLWATWCAPCRKEMPSLDRLQKALGGPRFEVVALSQDQAGIGKVREFYRQIGIKHLRILVDTSAKSMWSLSATALPTTLLVAPDGHEIARIVGAAKWDAPEMEKHLRNWIERLKGPSQSKHNLSTGENKQ